MISRSLAASMTVTQGAKPNVNEKRTIFKPLGLGPWRGVPTRHPYLTSSGSVGALHYFRKKRRRWHSLTGCCRLFPLTTGIIGPRGQSV